MCKYRYTYYTLCQHGELNRLSYCDKAKQLGLPEKHDRRRGRSPGPSQGKNRDKDKKPSGDAGPSSHNRSSTSSSRRGNGAAPPSRGSQKRPHIPPMSTAVPSQASPARGWTQVSSSPAEEHPHIANRIPRSIHADLDTRALAEHVGSREYLQYASASSSSLNTADYNRVNINIPLDPTSDFSMSVTHEDGKVQEIVTRFESLSVRDGSTRLVSDDIHVRADARARSMSASTAVQTESDTETETVREYPTHHSGIHEAHDICESPKAHSSPFSIGQHDSPRGTGVETSPSVHTAGSSTLSRKASKRNGKAADPGEADHEPTSPRKRIPVQWGAGPSLATAARALQRESRKKPLQSDIPVAAGRKSIRGARAAVEASKAHHHGTEAATFLTKDAVDPIEGDMTAQTLNRSPTSKLRQCVSKGSVKSPSSSPLRGSPGANSTIQITVSPSRSTRGSITKLDSASHSSMADRLADRLADSSKHPRAPSSVASVSGYATARQSPVSEDQDSEHSEHSYHTAPCELSGDDDVSEYELANAGDAKQMAKKDGTKPHCRGKSEPHVKLSPAGKTTATRPAPPSLSLRIPQSGSLSTDRISPMSAPSSASGTPTSPEHASHPSRIPRIPATAKEEEAERQEAEKCNVAVETSSEQPQHTAVLSPIQSPIQSPTPRHAPDWYADAVDPRSIPLPETPAPQMFRHVRTLNDNGDTPIISSTPTKTVLQGVESVEARVDQGADTVFAAPPAATVDQAIDAVLVAPTVAAAAPKVTPEQKDPVLHDSAILFSRRKSDASGNLRPEAAVYESSSVSSPSTAVGSTTPTDSDGASHVRDSQEQAVAHDRNSTTTGRSPVSKLAFEWKPEATEFVPKEKPVDKPIDKPDAPQDVQTQEGWAQDPQLYAQFSQALPPFDPYGLDVNGLPLYHLMFPVPIGPGTAYDFRAFNPYNTSPRRNKKKFNNSSPKRQRQTRSDNTNGSPTKSLRTDETKSSAERNQVTAAEAIQAAAAPTPEDNGGDTTPRPAAAALAASIGMNPEELKRTSDLSTSEAGMLTANSAFAAQDRIIEQQKSSLRLSEGATGRSSRVPTPTGWMTTQNVAHPEPEPQQPVPRALHRQPQAPQALRDDRADRAFIHPGPQLVPDNVNGGYMHNTFPYQNSRGPQSFPSFPRQQHVRPSLYGLAPQNNGLYENRYENRYEQPRQHARYNRRNQYWNQSAGVPLNETDFPNPVAPPGPRPAEAITSAVEACGSAVSGAGDSAVTAPSSSTDYVGYSTVRETCGEMKIVESAEWHGGVCNKCSAKHVH